MEYIVRISPEEARKLSEGGEFFRQEVLEFVITEFKKHEKLEAIRYTDVGRLTGCGVDYAVLVRDWVYSNGAPVMLVGSLNTFFAEGKVLSFALKVKGNEVVLAENDNWGRGPRGHRVRVCAYGRS